MSGRWAEASIPLDNKGSFVSVSVFYGVAGASGGGDAYRINERLFSMIIVRIMSEEDAPHILLTDANIDQNESFVLRNAVRDGKIINVVDDRSQDEERQPTFKHGGIDGKIEDGTTGSSTIDYV